MSPDNEKSVLEYFVDIGMVSPDAIPCPQDLRERVRAALAAGTDPLRQAALKAKAATPEDVPQKGAKPD